LGLHHDACGIGMATLGEQTILIWRTLVAGLVPLARLAFIASCMPLNEERLAAHLSLSAALTRRLEHELEG